MAGTERFPSVEGMQRHSHGATKAQLETSATMSYRAFEHVHHIAQAHKLPYFNLLTILFL